MCKYKLYTNTCYSSFFKSVPSTTQPLDYSKVYFPYFPSRVNAVIPIGKVSLHDFIESHKNPKKEILEVFKEIENASLEGDSKKKDFLKQQKLFYFTPSADVDRRRYENIKSFNPIIVAEYDKIGEEKASKLKKAIFNRFKSCICAYLSPSRQGAKFLFYCPLFDSIESYKEYFNGLAYYLSKVEGFDHINTNPIQPLFLSFDKAMLVREATEVEPWTVRGFKVDSFTITESIEDYTPLDNISEEDRLSVENIVRSIVKKADREQVGHINVRSASLIAGGYVGAGYMSEDEMWDILEDEILSSEYLSKGVEGYLKTARQMLVRGALAPLELERN